MCNSRLNRVLRLIGFIIFAASGLSYAQEQSGSELRWWKGNLHDHTLWSDGDDYPEMVAAWYKEHGYHFLSITDHNTCATEGKWIDPNSKGGMTAYEKYVQRFGKDWVQTREEAGSLKVKLRALPEFRSRLEEPGRFLFIAGEEVSDSALDSPVHLNAINLQAVIPPQGGGTIFEAIQKNTNAILEPGRSTGQPILATLNHPNFFLARAGWLPNTAEDAAQVAGLKFVEVFNGHPGVFNTGNGTQVDMDRWWDIVLTQRLADKKGEILYGVATDDAHNYHEFAPGRANPARGWVMVRSSALQAESLIAALEAGDFYASTGVALEKMESDEKEIRIAVAPEAGVTYKIQFIGTRRGFNPQGTPMTDGEGKTIPGTCRYDGSIGAVLAEAEGTSAAYPFAGDEIYVRAKVVSSKIQANGVHADDRECAWCQPVVGKGQ